MLAEKRFDTGEISLNYAEAGDPHHPPLVLLHGGSARWQWLTDVINAFADRWHVFAPDLRGHGKSSHTPWRYSDTDFAGDIAALLLFIGEPAILIGHSLGGRIAAMTAVQNPAFVRALVIGDPPLWLDNVREHHRQNEVSLREWAELAGKPAAEIAEYLKDVPVVWGNDPNPRPARVALGEDAPWFALMAGSLAVNDPTVLLTRLQTEETYSAFVPETLFPRITCPTLLLQADSEAGGLLSDWEVQRALALVPDARHVRFEGIGHGLFTQDLATVIKVIGDFLTTI